jgi:hypothetical protein
LNAEGCFNFHFVINRGKGDKSPLPPVYYFLVICGTNNISSTRGAKLSPLLTP